MFRCGCHAEFAAMHAGSRQIVHIHAGAKLLDGSSGDKLRSPQTRQDAEVRLDWVFSTAKALEFRRSGKRAVLAARVGPPWESGLWTSPPVPHLAASASIESAVLGLESRANSPSSWDADIPTPVSNVIQSERERENRLMELWHFTGPLCDLAQGTGSLLLLPVGEGSANELRRGPAKCLASTESPFPK
ncbi:unnamed protein product [Lampetra fluviatilis]